MRTAEMLFIQVPQFWFGSRSCMKRLGHVDGFCGPEYESFKTREEAQAFLAATPVVPQSPLLGPSYSALHRWLCIC